MYQRFTGKLLHLLRVPPEPHPPHGDPGSLQVFRAGRNFFNLKLFGWCIGQVLAFAGIIFWIAVFAGVEAEMRARRQDHRDPVSFKSVRNFDEYIVKIGAAKPAPAVQAEQPAVEGSKKKKTSRPRARINGWAGFKRILGEFALWVPPWGFPLLWVFKILGILVYLVQLPVTYALARLDYEMRWYMVTDRSLRIRHGVWSVAESTMSFANIQQVVVSQGPLQRLLGLADVKVQSAGGGGDSYDSHGSKTKTDDLHLGLFHHVTNAPEIRDLILARLRRFRESGLGDPDEKPAQLPAAATAGVSAAPDLLAAARELTAEARALRASLG